MVLLVHLTLLLILPATILSDFLTDYFRQRSSLGNDYIYEYYDGGILSGGAMFANKDIAGGETTFDYDVVPDPIDICAMDAAKTRMFCKCGDVKVHCIVFENIPADGAVWDAFAQYPSIEFLHFSPRPFGQEWHLPVRALRYLPKLESLTIRHTKMPVLKTDALSQLPMVKNIEMNNNHIETIEFGAFTNLPKLEQLALSENYLTQVDSGIFFGLPRLRALYLDRNNISIIADDVFADLGNLQELDLWANQIKTIRRMTFNGLHHLQRLDLASNHITKLDSETFVSVPHLRELLLQENAISVIEPGTFDNLPHLISLKLTGNRIKSFSGMPFQHLSSLMLLDVRENSMKTMTSSVLMTIPNIHQERMDIRFDENPFQCDCNLYWMRQLLDSNITSALRSSLELVLCKESDENTKILNLTQVKWRDEECQRLHLDNQVMQNTVQDDKVTKALQKNDDNNELSPSAISRVDGEILTNVNQQQHAESANENEAVKKSKENKNICTFAVPNFGLTLASISTLFMLELIPLIIN